MHRGRPETSALRPPRQRETLRPARHRPRPASPPIQQNLDVLRVADGRFVNFRFPAPVRRCRRSPRRVCRARSSTPGCTLHALFHFFHGSFNPCPKGVTGVFDLRHGLVVSDSVSNCCQQNHFTSPHSKKQRQAQPCWIGRRRSSDAEAAIEKNPRPYAPTRPHPCPSPERQGSNSPLPRTFPTGKGNYRTIQIPRHLSRQRTKRLVAAHAGVAIIVFCACAALFGRFAIRFGRRHRKIPNEQP